ncbi:MAG: aquaporin, partial [Lachnospiraceae bacterium]|nr:aquaporin [Lachnospiraceae bacterium]
MRLNKKYLMEFFGTAIFMFVVCATAMFIGAENNDFYKIYKIAFNIYAYTGAFLIAFVAAVTYILLYVFFSKVTLCHFNPIFTFAYLADGRIKGKEFVYYVISQIMGAISGLGLIVKIKEYMNMPDATRTVVGMKKVYDSMGNKENVALLVGGVKAKLANIQGKYGTPYPEAFGFILEVVLALILVWVVLKTTSDKNTRRLRGVFIGISMGLVYWLGITYTATMLNPAKEIASIVINASLKRELMLNELFIFIMGPIAGAGIAVGIYKKYEILEKYEQLIGAIIFVVFSSAILLSLSPMYTLDASLDISKYENYVMIRDTAIVNLLAPIGIAVSFLVAHFISGSKRITMFNPLVSLAQYVSKQIDAKQCILDIILQSIGMLLGFVPLVWIEKEVLRRNELSCRNSISQYGNIGLIVAIVLVLILYAILIGMVLYLNRKIHIFSMFMMAGIMIPINVIAIRFIGVIDNPIRSILIATISKEFKDTMILAGIMLVIALVVGILHNKMLKLLKKSYIREMLGTYMLMLFSVGAAMSIGLQMSKMMRIEYMIAIIATIVIIGLTYIVLYYSFGLNAQFNPVISMAQWFNKVYSLKETLVNICMQIIGAVGAFATLVGIY